jgi:hypothetical protein
MLAARGLNANHNHDLKNIFKGTATLASVTAGPFQDFYTALLAKGMKVSMARLTLAGPALIIPKDLHRLDSRCEPSWHQCRRKRLRTG